MMAEVDPKLALNDLKTRQQRIEFIRVHGAKAFSKLVAADATERGEKIRSQARENLEASKHATRENLSRVLRTKF